MKLQSTEACVSLEIFRKNLSEIEQYLWMVGGWPAVLMLSGVTAVTIYASMRPKPPKKNVLLHEQSYILPGPEMIHVSKSFEDAKDGKVLTFIYQDIRTLYESFLRGVKESNNGNCLGWREGPDEPYKWQSYNKTLLRANNFGSGLLNLGLAPGQKTFVGIFAKNCPEWTMTELAAYCYSMVVVPLYDTLGAEACGFIINQTEMSIIVCEDDAKVNTLLDQSLPSLKVLIMIKEASSSTHQKAQHLGVQIIKFQDVENQGAQKHHSCVLPKPDDLCTISYTSGTMGVPKGVMLTHANVISCVSSGVLHFGDHQPTKNDVVISVLPLAHMLERVYEHIVYLNGGSVGFYSGDVQRLGEDLVALKPTLFVVVPRLLNKVYFKTIEEVSKSKLKSMLFSMALYAKESLMKRGITRNDTIWDKLVFRKVREGMGGRLRLLTVGSAPLAGNVLTFIRCALGCEVVEGYGQTETSAPSTCTLIGDCTPERVGPPIACCQIKLKDVPEMKYYAAHNRGEVCIKGANVFKGYYKEPQKTKEVFDEDGWLCTGDIGEWLPDGALKIIDRKKHIFKLSQGEYVVPEKIENIYISSPYVEQVFVHGESLKSSIIAIVVPVEDMINRWASDHGIKISFKMLCDNDRVKKEVMDSMLQLGRKAGLKAFEQVKDIYLHWEPFTIQNGQLTPTMKSKRPEIRNFFKEHIEVMYNKLN